MRSFLPGTAVLGLLAVTYPTLASAQITPSGGGYLFRAKYIKGQKITYVSTVTTPAAGPAASGSQTLTRTVKEVNGKVGTLVVDVSPLKVNGRDMRPGNKAEIKFDERNNVIGGTVGQDLGGGFAFPEKPLHPGDSLTVEREVPTPFGNVKVKSAFKFVGVKTQGNRKVAVITLNLTSTGQATVKGTGVVAYDVADGSLFSTKSDVDFTLEPGGNPMKLKTAIVRK